MYDFAGIVGQKQAVELLRSAIAQNRIAPAYLFAGADGVGRSLAARCFIQQLFSSTIQLENHPDLLWVQPTYLHSGQLLTAKEAAETGLKRKAPPQIRLEQVREIGQFLARPPLNAPRSVVVIEQAETMAEAAANGLLKTLEEPGRATIVMIAPSAESLLPTLVSRCQRIPFYRLSEEDMVQVLQKAGRGEIVGNEAVMGMAQGSPGEAIAHWEQLQQIPNELLSDLNQLPLTHRRALELARDIDKTLDTEAQLWLVDYLQHCYWQIAQHKPLYAQNTLQQLEKVRQYLLSYVQPRLVWEVTLLAMSKSA